jgi:hypothetical protein
VAAAPVLFDKSIEEREAQAAESWRICASTRVLKRIEQTLAISAFLAITMAHSVRGNLGRMRFV